MNITVTQLPETKEFESMGKRYRSTYPNGYPVSVRCVWHCSECNVEVGGYFGNKVYGNKVLGMCAKCVDLHDPIAQICYEQTGMSPTDYQQKHGRAWNE
jgi:hypothetical protein